MKSVLLIGLGRFGRHMAEKLKELHHEVLAVDRNEDRVNDILPLVTNAQIGDSTNEQFIASLGGTARFSLPCRMILVFLMYFGRVGGLTMIYAFTANNRAISSQFPQEPVTVG